jgi:sporulation protein YlmC with PRC-barrel domain
MSQHNPAHFGLEKLSDAGLTIADPSQDTRGRTVVDCDGVRLGHVSGLFIDVEHRKVRMMELRSGGFHGIGDRHFLIPIETVRAVTADEVHIGETSGRLLEAPVYDPLLVEPPTSASLQSHYDHYGVTPTWSTGASSSESPTQQF